MLAERFPRPDLPTLIAPLAATSCEGQLALERVIFTRPEHGVPATANSFPSPATVMHKVAPLAPERHAVQRTVDWSTFEKLRYAPELLGRSVPSGELAQVLDRALDALIDKLEREKFAKTDRPAPAATATTPAAGAA